VRKLEQHGAPVVTVEQFLDLVQYHVATYFDGEMPGVDREAHRGGRELKAIAQRLKGQFFPLFVIDFLFSLSQERRAACAAI
jgi:DNA-directed RNA polymerase beta' subunit